MKTLVTLQFLEEARAHRLRYTCDECAHFVGGAAQEDESCAHGYPLGERRDRPLHEGDVVSFCKEWEGA
jgi:hypothetical protein